MNVCYPCYELSSLLPLAGNRDDSNRDDIKYEHSHLLCCLEANIGKCLYHNIYANNAFSVLGLVLFTAYYFFLKRLVTGFTGCNPCYQLSSMLPVMFAQNIKLPNTLLLHLFTGLKVGACRYILQKMRIHFLQYHKEYLILCV